MTDELLDIFGVDIEILVPEDALTEGIFEGRFDDDYR